MKKYLFNEAVEVQVAPMRTANTLTTRTVMSYRLLQRSLQTSTLLGVQNKALSLLIAALLVATGARADVHSIKKLKGTRTFTVNEYVPLFPGNNEIGVRGRDVQNATNLHFPPGIADSSVLRQKHVDRNGVGYVVASIHLKHGTYGKISARLTYPQGRRDTFYARIFRRGVVRSIQAPPSAKIGETIRVTFTGRELGVATLKEVPQFTAQRIGGSNTTAQFDLVFHQCGTLQLRAGLLHDVNVPSSEVISGEAAYAGTPNATIVVTSSDHQRCPSTSLDASSVPFSR